MQTMETWRIIALFVICSSMFFLLFMLTTLRNWRKMHSGRHRKASHFLPYLFYLSISATLSCAVLAVVLPSYHFHQQGEFVLGGILEDLPKVMPNLVAEGVVPDVIPYVPKRPVVVYYPNGDVRMGNEFLERWVKRPPRYHLNAWYGKSYTLLLVCPDVPTRVNSTDKHQLLWLVYNIQDRNDSASVVLQPYISPNPARGSGNHRYVFVVYEQTTSVDLVIPERTIRFDLKEYVRDNHLSLWAANFFVLRAEAKEVAGNLDPSNASKTAS